MNSAMVKVSGRVEPLPALVEGAGVADLVGVAGVSSTGVATGVEDATGVAVLEGAAEATGVADLVGVAGAVPELAPSQTAGPGIL